MSVLTHPRVALIGAGALASALGPALREAGFAIPLVVDRTAEGAAALAETIGAAASTRAAEALDLADWVCCCVPDDALAQVALSLLDYQGDWTQKVVFHTAGAVSSEVFASLSERGASVLSFHPVQTFSLSGSSASWRGISVGIEGPEEGLQIGRRLALALGARPFEIATSDKALYHAAAAVASNFSVTVVAMATEMLGACALPAERSLEILRPLLQGTMQHLLEIPPEQALTGPVVRGDVRTVRSQLSAIAAQTPHLLPVVAALVTETVRLSVRSGRLTDDLAASMLQLVSEALDPS